MTGRECCGRQGVVWQAWSGVADMEWCGRQGVVWLTGSGVTDRKWCAAVLLVCPTSDPTLAVWLRPVGGGALLLTHNTV